MDVYMTEEQFEASGALQPVGENETTLLFRDMEHELEVLTQRHHVPPEDLEQLFQVRLEHYSSSVGKSCWFLQGMSLS